MYKNWMSEDLVAKLNLEGLMSLDPHAIEDAASVREDVEDSIAVLQNSLDYACWLRDHIDEIKGNIKIIDDCSYDLLGIVFDWNGMSFLSAEQKKAVESYFNTLNDVGFITIRCNGITMPDEPFTSVLRAIENEEKATLGKSEALTKAKTNIVGAIEVSKSVANRLTDLVKYEVRSEYPDFDESKIGILETIFSSKPEWELKDIADMEDAILELKDQLVCIDDILDSTV